MALDPGHNLGVACLAEDGALLAAGVIRSHDLPGLGLPAGVRLVSGDGTGAGELLVKLRRLGLAAETTNEEGTSLEGRSLYWMLNPPRGLLRLLPAGLRPSPAQLDAWAAYAIGLRHLGVAAAAARDRRPA